MVIPISSNIPFLSKCLFCGKKRKTLQGLVGVKFEMQVAGFVVQLKVSRSRVRLTSNSLIRARKY